MPPFTASAGSVSTVVDVDLRALLEAKPFDELPDIRDLLRPPEWHARAACRGRSDVDFFPTVGQPLDPARAVCSGCPVLEECRDYSIAHDEGHGVWGGTSARDRRLYKQTGTLPHRAVAKVDTPSATLHQGSREKPSEVATLQGQRPTVAPTLSEQTAPLVLDSCACGLPAKRDSTLCRRCTRLAS